MLFLHDHTTSLHWDHLQGDRHVFCKGDVHCKINLHKYVEGTQENTERSLDVNNTVIT